METGGSALSSQPAAGGAAEAVGIALAAVVLLITFGSLAAAGLPLLTAVIGVGIGMCAILALGSAPGLSVTTGTLASVLGLAVGIDYALFVVSRYREERAAGHEPREAAGLAVGTAGSAVVLAGLTVVIALTGLSVVGVPMLTKDGSVRRARAETPDRPAPWTPSRTDGTREREKSGVPGGVPPGTPLVRRRRLRRRRRAPGRSRRAGAACGPRGGPGRSG
ncbi:hypothetical protein SUDANB176_05638 [Streptomyces sp. enrichment culture]